jgi:hypothetical protein
VFYLLGLFSLPAALSAFSVLHSIFPAVIINPSIIALVAWVAHTFIQLVHLSALMVGHNSRMRRLMLSRRGRRKRAQRPQEGSFDSEHSRKGRPEGHPRCIRKSEDRSVDRPILRTPSFSQNSFVRSEYLDPSPKLRTATRTAGENQSRVANGRVRNTPCQRRRHCRCHEGLRRSRACPAAKECVAGVKSS